MNFKEVREKFPQYSDLSDEQLAQGLHKKFYSDVPYEQFIKKIGLSKEPEFEKEAKILSGRSTIEGMVGEGAKGIVRGVSNVALSIPKAVGTMMFGPIGGEFVSKGVEALATPSRELFKETPGPVGESMAGVGGEFLGGMIAPNLPGMVQAGAQALGKIPHLPVISTAVKGTGHFVDRLLPGGAERSVGRTLLTLAGDKRAPIIQALGEAKEIVPGSVPTATQAAAKAGSAEFAGAQRIAEQRLPTEYLDIATGGEKARQGLIQSFGGTPEKLEAAITARSKEAEKLYGIAKTQLVKADDTLKDLFSRPSMGNVIKRARDLAGDFNRPFQIGKDEPAKIVEGLIVGEKGGPLTRQLIAAKQATYPVESLHFVKMGMDDLIKNPERFSIGATEVKAIQGIRSEFISWLGNKSPAYDAARRAFAEASRPINVMQVGQQLEKGLTAPLAGAERPTPFATAMREAPRTIERATGSPRFTTLEQAVGKDNAAAAQSVLDDLSRIAQHEKLEKAGAGRAKEIVGQSFPSLPATGPLNQVYMIFKTVFNRFGGSLTEKEILILSKSLKTPEATLRLMNNAAKREALVLSMINPQLPYQQMTLGQKLGGGAIGGAASIGMNEP